MTNSRSLRKEDRQEWIQNNTNPWGAGVYEVSEETRDAEPGFDITGLHIDIDTDSEQEKKKPRQRFIDEVWPGMKLV